MVLEMWVNNVITVFQCLDLDALIARLIQISFVWEVHRLVRMSVKLFPIFVVME